MYAVQKTFVAQHLIVEFKRLDTLTAYVSLRASLRLSPSKIAEDSPPNIEKLFAKLAMSIGNDNLPELGGTGNQKGFSKQCHRSVEYFKARIRCNMRLIICVSPDCFLVKDEAL